MLEPELLFSSVCVHYICNLQIESRQSSPLCNGNVNRLLSWRRVAALNIHSVRLFGNKHFLTLGQWTLPADVAACHLVTFDSSEFLMKQHLSAHTRRSHFQ